MTTAAGNPAATNLWLDTRKLRLFHAGNGRALGRDLLMNEPYA